MINAKTDATDIQLEQLALRAVNDVTREIAAKGITLTDEQADDLGEEVIAWMRTRLDLMVNQTDAGVECTPRQTVAE